MDSSFLRFLPLRVPHCDDSVEAVVVLQRFILFAAAVFGGEGSGGVAVVKLRGTEDTDGEFAVVVVAEGWSVGGGGGGEGVVAFYGVPLF